MNDKTKGFSLPVLGDAPETEKEVVDNKPVTLGSGIVMNPADQPKPAQYDKLPPLNKRVENVAGRIAQPAIRIAAAPAKLAYDVAKGILVDLPTNLREYERRQSAVMTLRSLGHPVSQADVDWSNELNGEIIVGSVGLQMGPMTNTITKGLMSDGIKGAAQAMRQTDPSLVSTFGTRDIPPGAIAKADKMLAQGKSGRDIWEATSPKLMRDRSGKWVREYDDSTLAFTDKLQPLPEPGTVTPVAKPGQAIGWTNVQTGSGGAYSATGMLGDVLNDAPVFQQYPEFKGIEVKVDIRKGAGREGTFFYDAQRDKYIMHVTADNHDQALGVITHEIQHAIQEVDGLAKGGNPRDSAGLRADFEKQKGVNIFNSGTAMSKALQPYGTVVQDKGYQLHAAVRELEELENLPQAEYSKTRADRDKLYIEIDQLKYDLYPKLNPKDKQLIEEQLKVTMDNIAAIYPGDHEAYKRLAGEVQARLTQQRTGLDAATRDNIYPGRTEGLNAFGLSEDIDPAKQIDRFAPMNPDGIRKSVDETPRTPLQVLGTRNFADNYAKDIAGTPAAIDADQVKEITSVIQNLLRPAKDNPYGGFTVAEILDDPSIMEEFLFHDPSLIPHAHAILNKLKGSSDDLNVRRSVDEPRDPLNLPSGQVDDLTVRRAKKQQANDNTDPKELGVTREELFDEGTRIPGLKADNPFPPEATLEERLKYISSKQGKRDSEMNHQDFKAWQQELRNAKYDLDVRRKYYFNDDADIPLDGTRLAAKVSKDMRAANPILWKRSQDADLMEGVVLQLEGMLTGKDPVKNLQQRIGLYRKWIKEDTRGGSAVDAAEMTKMAEALEWAYEHYFKGK